MKARILLLIALLFSANLIFSQALRDSVKVKTDIYEVIYSEKLEQPRFIKYEVLCPAGTASRAGMDFYTNDTIKTSDNLDYIKNLYDKGHLAPAADFNCTKDMLKKTFSYLNCALQDQYLNRGVWRILEEYERELAKTSKVTVTIELVFTAKSKKLSTGATVPDGFYKTIYVEKTKKTYKYYFPNVKPTKLKYSDYLLGN
jgi:endonuclease G